MYGRLFDTKYKLCKINILLFIYYIYFHVKALKEKTVVFYIFGILQKVIKNTFSLSTKNMIKQHLQ